MGPCGDRGPLASVSLLMGDQEQCLSRGPQADAGRAQGLRFATPVVTRPSCASAQAVLKPTAGQNWAFERLTGRGQGHVGDDGRGAAEDGGGSASARQARPRRRVRQNCLLFQADPEHH